jgi:bacillithiol system protein YtxJ
MEEWDHLIVKSHSEPIIIFKHSNACGSSTHAHQTLLAALESGLVKEPIHIVVVQTAREISDRIAVDISVRHQSPQVLVIRDGKRRYDASHFSIQPQKMVDVLELI